MKAKTKIGMGMKPKKKMMTKKRILFQRNEVMRYHFCQYWVRSDP